MAAFQNDATKLTNESSINESYFSDQQWWNRLLAFENRTKFDTDGTFNNIGSLLRGKQVLQEIGPKGMAIFWNNVVNNASWYSSIQANQERNPNKLGDSSEISIQTIDWVLKNKHGIEKSTFATVVADFLLNNSIHNTILS